MILICFQKYVFGVIVFGEDVTCEDDIIFFPHLEGNRKKLR